MNGYLSVVDTMTLLDFLRQQEELLTRRLKKTVGKKITLMQFSGEEFDLASMQDFLSDVHRTIFLTERKKLVKEATQVQGTLVSYGFHPTDASLTVIPWNNTTNRSEPAKVFEFEFTVALILLWTYPSYRRVPCVLFEDHKDKVWYILRIDDMPFDGLD